MAPFDPGEELEQRSRQQDRGHRCQSRTTVSTAQISGRLAVI
jgi:hypothetical protein